MDAKHAREAGDILCRRAAADAKTLGPGSISQANRQRARWGLTTGGDLFPSSVSVPTVRDLGAFVVALGSDMPSYCERVARYASGPIADFMVLAESVKDRRRESRIPKYMSVARGRTWEPPADLGEGVLEALEEMRFDDPRTALKASRDALKTATGPIAVGRVLAIHASNLREVDELGDALLALQVAIPALDLAGDAWGMGRALAGASAVAHACGKAESARKLIDWAECWHIQASSVIGRASALSWRGVLALNDGDTQSALCELDAPLALFPRTRRRSVAGVYQIRALALVRCGDLDRAREAIAKALATAPDARVFRGRIAWHAADIESAAGNHAAAEHLYLQAFDLVTEPLCDRLLLAAQAVRAATRQGEGSRTAWAARRMLGSIFESVEEKKEEPTRGWLRAAHRDLYVAALDAGLPATVVDQAIGHIEST